MNYNFRCKQCNWGCFIDPDLAKDSLKYQCAKCSSVYMISGGEIGTQ